MAQRKLFDNATLKRLKKYPLYSQDGKGDKAVVSAKIFNPYGRGAFYITEWDGDDTLFGYSTMSGRHDDPNNEYGYFSKSALENTRVNVMGVRLPLERDTSYSTPKTLGDVKEQELGRPKAQASVKSNFSNNASNAQGVNNAKGNVIG